MAPPDIDTMPYYRHEESFEDAKEQSYNFPLAPKRRIPNKIMDIDLKSKDNKVCRDERMIRLTGMHVAEKFLLVLISQVITLSMLKHHFQHSLTQDF